MMALRAPTWRAASAFPVVPLVRHWLWAWIRLVNKVCDISDVLAGAAASCCAST